MSAPMHTARSEPPRPVRHRLGLVLCAVALWLQVLQPMLVWHEHRSDPAGDHGGWAATRHAGATPDRDRAPAGPSGRAEQADQHACGLCTALQLARTLAAPEPPVWVITCLDAGDSVIAKSAPRSSAFLELLPQPRAPPARS